MSWELVAELPVKGSRVRKLLPDLLPGQIIRQIIPNGNAVGAWTKYLIRWGLSDYHASTRTIDGVHKETP